jgi:eukaryotic-like serine/threonine-protein kinase
MQLILNAAGILGIIVAVVWWFAKPGFDPLYAFLTGLAALLGSFVISTKETRDETLDQRNRRVMLNHVENFWIRGVFEKSLHGMALLELGIKEDPTAISYPRSIKRESTGEILPAEKSMLEIFEEIGLGRSLLILGSPGSGKTTLLLELARQLIECARQDDTEPIPVVFNLSSWKENETLVNWLAEQLHLVYYVPKKTAPFWVSENRMLLLLDGLDEVSEGSRAKCVEAINRFRKQYGFTSLAVCSRSQDYEELGVKLSFEGAIEVQPLTQKQVLTFFDSAGKELAGLRQVLKKDSALREMAETPLFLNIMAMAYRDRQDVEILASKDKDAQRRHLFESYIEHMFERPRSSDIPFTKQNVLRWLSWLAQKMITYKQVPFVLENTQPIWLTQKQLSSYQRITASFIGILVGLILFMPFLGVAVGLEAGLIIGLISGFIGGIIQLEAKESTKWNWKATRIGIVVGLIAGCVFGIADVRNWFFYGGWFGNSLVDAIALGIFGGLFGGILSKLIINLRVIHTVDLITWDWIKAWMGMFIGFVFGALSFGLISGLSDALTSRLLSAGLDTGLIYGAYGGFFGALIGLSFGGLAEKKISSTAFPGQGLSFSAKNFLYIFVAISLIFLGIMTIINFVFGDGVLPVYGFVNPYYILNIFGLNYLDTGNISTLIFGVDYGLAVGLSIGLAIGMTYGGFAVAKHYILRIILALNDILPLKLIPFLDCCVSLIFLRRVGGSYIFVHRLLMEHFAEMDV